VPPHRLMSLPRNLARCATLRHLPPVLGKEQGRKLCQVFIKLELSEDVWFGAPSRRHTVLSLSLYLGLLLRDFPPLLDPTFFSSQREVLKIRGYTSSNSSRPYCQPHRSLYHFPLGFTEWPPHPSYMMGNCCSPRKRKPDIHWPAAIPTSASPCYPRSKV
jgi:hypothetical protein